MRFSDSRVIDDSSANLAVRGRSWQLAGTTTGAVETENLRRWSVLFGDGSRPLMLPFGHRRAQESAIRFFLHPLGRMYAHALLYAHRFLPQTRLVGELALPPFNGQQLIDELQLSKSTPVAFQIGTAGPYQKASMLVSTDAGEPVALFKIAVKASADEMVVREARWLDTLQFHASLRGAVPRLLAYGSVRSGRRYLGSSLAPGSATTRAFTPAHATFLAALAQTGMTYVRFVDSPAFRYLDDTFSRLQAVMPITIAELLRNGLDYCADRLDGWHGPFVPAHGDFAPWNIRLHDRGIFVFDWEYAKEGALTLHDLCHFHLAPHAVTGRIGVRELRRVLMRIRRDACSTYSAGEWGTRIVAAQCLGYLLHTILHYSASRDRVLEDHPVIKAYCRLIEERAQWAD